MSLHGGGRGDRTGYDARGSPSHSMADSILHPRASLGLTVAPLEAPKSLLLIKPVESDYDRCLADFDEPDPEPEEVETAVMRLFQQRLHSSASDDATEIIPGLYLGNAVAARHTEWLAATAPSWYLINCAGSMEVARTSEAFLQAANVQTHVELDMIDSEDYDARLAVEHGVAWITAGMDARSAVLCHCLVGMSRSVTVVIAYLMLMKGMTLRDAAGLVKDKRPIAYPNLGYWKLLRELELSTFNESTVPEMALVFHQSYRRLGAS